MTLTEARKYLRRAQINGYVAYHSGIVRFEDNGKITNTGINIDGDGHDGRLFGCPEIIWSAEQAEAMFPAKRGK